MQGCPEQERAPKGGEASLKWDTHSPSAVVLVEESKCSEKATVTKPEKLMQKFKAGLLGREMLSPGLESVIGNILLELSPSMAIHSRHSSSPGEGGYVKCLPPIGGNG